MRALRLHGTDDLRLDEIESPHITPDQVTIAVDACGVCGSDIHFVDGSARTDHHPITLGHEVAGRIAEPGASRFQPGDEVVAEVGHYCMVCPRCIEGRPNLCERARVLGIDVDGGFADLIAVPSESVVRKPAGLDSAAAATAVDAGATSLHAVERRARVRPGESVLIIGIGGLGAYAIQWARAAGAGVVVAADTSEDALRTASAVGADKVLLVEPSMSVGRQVKLFTGGGVDAAVEFVGEASAVDAAVKSLRPGGRAVTVGVSLQPVHSLPVVLWSNHEYSLLGAYGSLPGDAARVLAALAEGTITPPATVDVDLGSARDLLQCIAAGQRTGVERPMVRP